MYVAHKALQRVEHELLGDVFGGEHGVFGVLHVIARGCGPEFQGCHVFLAHLLQFFDTFGGPSGAYQQHSGGQGVERACVAHFYLSSAHVCAKRVAHSVNYVERRGTIGLVESKYLSFEEIHSPLTLFACPRRAGRALLLLPRQLSCTSRTPQSRTCLRSR